MMRWIPLSFLLAVPVFLGGADEPAAEPAPKTEPAPAPAPAPAGSPGAEAQPTAPEKLAPPKVPKVIELDGIRIHPEEKYLELDATMCLDQGVIEVFGSSPGGKVHESLLILKAKPQYLHFGLLLMGLREGRPTNAQGGEEAPRGDPVDLFVEWEEGGKRYRVPAEDMVYNVHTKRRMEGQSWVFTGSRHVKGRNSNTGQEVDIYLANATGTVITTFRDQASVLDNASRFSRDDTSYVTNEAVAPPRNTPLCLVAMPQGKGPEERRRIAAPELSGEDAKRAPGLMDAALGADGAVALEAKRALAAMGRPVLAPLRARLDDTAEEARGPLQALLGEIRACVMTGRLPEAPPATPPAEAPPEQPAPDPPQP